MTLNIDALKPETDVPKPELGLFPNLADLGCILQKNSQPDSTRQQHRSMQNSHAILDENIGARPFAIDQNFEQTFDQEMAAVRSTEQHPLRISINGSGGKKVVMPSLKLEMLHSDDRAERQQLDKNAGQSGKSINLAPYCNGSMINNQWSTQEQINGDDEQLEFPSEINREQELHQNQPFSANGAAQIGQPDFIKQIRDFTLKDEKASVPNKFVGMKNLQVPQWHGQSFNGSNYQGGLDNQQHRPLSPFQSNASVYAPSHRQFNEMDEDDGIDIREQINFEFNEEYSEEQTGHFEVDNDADLCFDNTSHQNLNKNINFNPGYFSSTMTDSAAPNQKPFYGQCHNGNLALPNYSINGKSTTVSTNMNTGYLTYRQRNIRSALTSQKNSARGQNSMMDPHEMAAAGINSNRLNDSEINDDNTTGYEVEAVKPRAVVASQSDFQQKFKTEMCRNWELNGKCKFGTECTFAHGTHELLQKQHIPQNYRTKECKNFYQNLYCSYGERCQFYHSIKPEDLAPRTERQKYSQSLVEIRDAAQSYFRYSDDSLGFPNTDRLQLDNLRHVSKGLTKYSNFKELTQKNCKTTSGTSLPLLSELYPPTPPSFLQEVKEVTLKLQDLSLQYKKLDSMQQVPFDREKAEREFNQQYKIKQTHKQYYSATKIHSGHFDKKSQVSTQSQIRSAKKSAFATQNNAEVSHFMVVVNSKNETSRAKRKNNNKSISNSSGKNQYLNNNSISTITATSAVKLNPISNLSAGSSSCQFQFHHFQQQKQRVNGSSDNKNEREKAIPSNYQYHSPNHQQFNYQVPIQQLPHIKQFFPDLDSKKTLKILEEIKEINNDWEHVAAPVGRRERTNSDNWADNVQYLLQNDIKKELEKPSNLLVSSFTENMVFLHPPRCSQEK